jgi:hypothetical protein
MESIRKRVDYSFKVNIDTHILIPINYVTNLVWRFVKNKKTLFIGGSGNVPLSGRCQKHFQLYSGSLRSWCMLIFDPFTPECFEKKTNITEKKIL